MKKSILLALVALSCMMVLADARPKRTRSGISRETPRANIQRAVVDPMTVSQAEAMINQKRLLDTKLFTSNVVDEVTGEVTAKDFVRYHFRQAGVDWYEEKERVEISGRVGPKRYSKLKLLYAAEAAGKAGELKAALSAKETPSGLTYWDLFNAAMYLREDDENLMEGFRLAVESGLCTQEQLDAILEAAID